MRLTGGIGLQTRGVQFRVPDAGDRDKITQKLRSQSQSLGTSLTGAVQDYTVSASDDGLVQVVLTDAGISAKINRAVDQSIEVLRRRIDASGTREPTIQREGNDRILVEVPGLQDTQRLKDLLGTTAKLEFRLVADPGANPADIENLSHYKDNEPGTLPVERRIMVQGEDLTDAQPGFDQRTSEPVVNFRFNIRGGQQFGQVTSENVGKPFAIVLDNQIVSASAHPRAPSPGGSGQISGSFTVSPGQRPRRAAARRRPAGQADRGRGADRRPRPRVRIRSTRASAPRYVAGVPGRRLHAHDLRGLRRLRRHRHSRSTFMLIFAAMVLLGATLTLARHRRHRAHHRHGGRRQRADLRAHPRGEPRRPLGDHRVARLRLQARLRDHRGLPTSPCSWRR